MPVSFKIVLPETGDTYAFDPHHYGKAVEKWHEEITWLDCDTYLLRVSTGEAGEEEQIEVGIDPPQPDETAQCLHRSSDNPAPRRLSRRRHIRSASRGARARATAPAARG